MTCALTTAGRIRDSILRDLKETKRHVIISHLSNVIIHFTQCFDKCMILLLSSLSVKFRISKYTTLAVFRRLLLYWIFFLDYAKKKKKEKKKRFQIYAKSMLMRKNHVAGLSTHLHTQFSQFEARCGIESSTKMIENRSKGLLNRFSPRFTEGRGTKDPPSSRRPRKPLDTRLHHIGLRPS